jgi:hypothetical protein
MTANVGLAKVQLRLTFANDKEHLRTSPFCLLNRASQVRTLPGAPRGREPHDAVRVRRAWLDGLANQGRKPPTLTGYRTVFANHLPPRLGDVQLQELPATDRDAVCVELMRSGRRGGGGLSMSSVHHVHAALTKFLNDAERSAPRRLHERRGPPNVKGSDIAQQCERLVVADVPRRDHDALARLIRSRDAALRSRFASRRGAPWRPLHGWRTPRQRHIGRVERAGLRRIRVRVPIVSCSANSRIDGMLVTPVF